jgi:hypothetical protein
MPTVKINITTGIEYSPTDEVDSGVKLHNFTVGTDGSLYKLPILKNLKNTQKKDVGSNYVWPYQILDLKKFQTSALHEPIPEPVPGYDFIKMDMFRRFIYLTTASYGVINVNYDKTRILNSDLPTEQAKYGEFEYGYFKYVPNTPGDPSRVALSSLNPQILVDFNAQYDSQGKPTLSQRCVFPAQHMFQSVSADGYNLLMEPRNIIHCSMDATSGDPDIKALSIFDVSGSERTKNDLARGCLLIGNRMFFYSAVDNAMYPSAPNNFRKQMKNPSDNTAFKITPAESLQSITDFNGNIITFTPSGIERWVLSSAQETIIQRDPTFHFDHRIRYGGSFVKANRDLYYYTDDFKVYRLNSSLGVDQIFNGTLPVYKPLENYLVKDEDLPMSYFEMLGFRFVSIGPWLYNIESNTWSTYGYDGWKGTEQSQFNWIWESDTAKRVISSGYDDLVCTYCTICTPLSYKEMHQLPDDIPLTLDDGGYQWGEVAFFTTRMLQEERTFSLDGVEVYVNGGVLQEGSTMWMQVLRGADQGDFEEEDESTYGVPAYYQTMHSASIGEHAKEHVGKFIWRTNLKTDRFRLQFITKEKKGAVIHSVLCNITNISDAQKFTENVKEQPSKQE